MAEQRRVDDGQNARLPSDDDDDSAALGGSLPSFFILSFC
jgi:hypothetical protein